MKVKQEAIINKNAAAVWEVMGNQFAQVHLWSSNFKSSNPGGDPKLPGLDYLYRDTVTARGQTIQELDNFDPDNYFLSYHISKGAPKIAKNARGDWSLEAIGPDKTKVTIEFFMDPKGLLPVILSPIIKKKLGKAGAEIAEELKYYIENGKPNPRKTSM
jgi:hypothetical protein